MAVNEADAGWHLALGRLIWSKGLPATNSLAWTEPDHPFYATSWLFDLASWASVDSAGIFGLQLLTCALLAATLLGVTVACHAVSPRAFWLPAVIAWLLVPRITPRPHMASWLILAATVALCLHATRERWWLRLTCVPLIAVGSNLHAGAIFSSVALGVFCLDAAVRERRWGREAGIAVAGGLALIANPGGPYNVWYALTHLRLYRSLPIQELQTPGLDELPAFWASLLPVLLLAFYARKQRPVLLALAVIFAVAGVFAARLAFKYYLVAAPILADGIQRLDPRPGRLLAVALVALALSTNVGRYSGVKLAATWDPHEIPVRAVEFVKREGLEGRLYNTFGDGGYLAWALPHVPVFQDARVLAYSPAFFKQQLDVEGSPPHFAAMLDRLNVEWALTSAIPGALTGAGLLRDPAWALIYWDDLSELRIRRDAPAAARLVPRLEFQVLRPDRAPPESVAMIRASSDAQVDRVEDELGRLAHAGLSAELTHLFQCAIDLRRARGATAACVEAGERWPGLVGPPAVRGVDP